LTEWDDGRLVALPWAKGNRLHGDVARRVEIGRRMIGTLIVALLTKPIEPPHVAERDTMVGVIRHHPHRIALKGLPELTFRGYY
jgi:hypothetical protein